MCNDAAEEGKITTTDAGQSDYVLLRHGGNAEKPKTTACRSE